MAEEKLQINAINAVWTGASGAVADIDEAIADADAAIYGPGPQDDVADFGMTATSGSISDSATITNIDIEVRVLDDGTAGTSLLDVILVIAGTPRGTTQITTTATMTNFQVGNAGWDVDWTKAQLDGAEIRLTPTQSGMPGTNQVDLDCAEIIITFTPPALAWDQDRFRAINDDGTETGSTFKAALNTAWMQVVDENFRIRFTVQNSGSAATEGFQLQRRLATDSWLDVNATSTVVRSANSPEAIEDGDDTTERLGGAQTYLTDAGGTNGYDDVNGEAGTSVFALDEEAEYEFCVQLRSADTKYGDRVQLRLVQDGGALLDTYTETPTLWADQVGAPTLRQVTKHTISMGTGSITATKTLTGGDIILDVDKTFTLWGYRIDSSDPQAAGVDINLDNTTTIRISRNATGGAVEALIYLVEFTNGVRVEHGVLAQADFTSGLASDVLQDIGSLSEAFCIYSIENNAGTVWDVDDVFACFLSADAGGVLSITAETTDTVSADTDIRYQVIQYKGTNVQRGENTAMGSAVTSVDISVPVAVDVAKSFINVSYSSNSSDGDIGAARCRARFTVDVVSGDQITVDRHHHGGASLPSVHWEVVEFTDNVTVQEVLMTFVDTDGSESDATLTAVVDGAVMASVNMFGGESEESATDNPGASTYTADLTTSTNLTAQRTSTLLSSDVVFQVIDFSAVPPAGGLSIPIAMYHHTKHNLVS